MLLQCCKRSLNISEESHIMFRGYVPQRINQDAIYLDRQVAHELNNLNSRIPFDFGGSHLKSNYRQSDDPVPFAQ